MKYITRRWNECTDLQLTIPISNNFEQLGTSMLHSIGPSQLRCLHLDTTMIGRTEELTKGERDLHMLLVTWLLCQAPDLEKVTFSSISMPALPALPHLKVLSMAWIDNFSGVARCLPHLSTLRSISLRGNSQMPFPDLLLADMPNLEVLKLRDILPAQLTMPKGFRGLHINVSSSTGADHTVWHQVGSAIVSYILYDQGEEIVVPDAGSVPRILLEPHTFDCLDLLVQSVGTHAEPLLLQGAFLRSKHVSFWAAKDIHAIIPGSEIAWQRIYMHANNTLNLTFKDLPIFIGSPLKFCFQYHALEGVDVSGMGYQCGRLGLPWYADAEDGQCTILNFEKPPRKSEEYDIGELSEAVLHCSCSACHTMIQGFNPVWS